MKTFTTTFSIRVLMAVTVILFILGIVMIDSAGAGEKFSGTGNLEGVQGQRSMKIQIIGTGNILS
jgi:hypothetical protein